METPDIDIVRMVGPEGDREPLETTWASLMDSMIHMHPGDVGAVLVCIVGKGYAGSVKNLVPGAAGIVVVAFTQSELGEAAKLLLDGYYEAETRPGEVPLEDPRDSSLGPVDFAKYLRRNS